MDPLDILICGTGQRMVAKVAGCVYLAAFQALTAMTTGEE